MTSTPWDCTTSPSVVAAVVLYLTIVLISSMEIRIERQEGGEEKGRREGGREGGEGENLLD